MTFLKYINSVLEGMWAGFCMLCMWIACPFHPLFHDAITQWGSSQEERTMVLPGDELLPDEAEVSSSTFAITINRPPADIWPWIVQMGMSKGAFYSYDCWENLCGCSMTCNANEIVPEWQSPSIGDPVYLAHPKCMPSISKETIKICEPEKHFVLGLMEDESGLGGIWSFHLIPIDANTTRFVSRLTAVVPDSKFLQCLAFFFFHIFGEPNHFMMQRKIMLGVKYRAEIHGAND